MPRRAACAVLLAAAAMPAAAHAESYTTIAGAPGYGPPKYARVAIDKAGPASARRVLVLIPGTYGGSGSLRLVAEELVKRVPGLAAWVIHPRADVVADTSY